jgi:hypothetical protein
LGFARVSPDVVIVAKPDDFERLRIIFVVGLHGPIVKDAVLDAIDARLPDDLA